MSYYKLKLIISLNRNLSKDKFWFVFTFSNVITWIKVLFFALTYSFTMIG